MAVEQPAVLEPGRLGLTSEGERALDRVLRLERESELHPAGSGCDEIAVGVRPAVSIELPGVADLLDPLEIEVAHDQLLVVRRGDVTDELAARIDEVALPVEIVVAEVLLDPDPVDRSNVIAVRDGVGDLLDPPQVLAQTA